MARRLLLTSALLALYGYFLGLLLEFAGIAEMEVASLEEFVALYFGLLGCSGF